MPQTLGTQGLVHVRGKHPLRAAAAILPEGILGLGRSETGQLLACWSTSLGLEFRV